MQGCLGPGAQGQHLQAGVEAPQLLLQAGGDSTRLLRASGHQGDTRGQSEPALWHRVPGWIGVPGGQRVVGHEGKVQERKEVLGADHAEAFGEVGVHPAEQSPELAWAWQGAVLAPQPWAPGSHATRGDTHIRSLSR